MIFAYADPPYLSRDTAVAKCSDHYAEHPDSAKWNAPEAHHDLIGELLETYPNGWALWASSSTLKSLLSVCPAEVRVLAWVKPWCAWRGQINPAYAWEPVIMMGGRKRAREKPKVLDFLVANAPLKTGTAGAKPEAFAFWMFRALGMRPGDEFIDIFPGSGAMQKAYERYCKQLSLFSS